MTPITPSTFRSAALTVSGQLAQVMSGTERVLLLVSRTTARSASRPHGGIRRYGATDVTRVKFVKSAQRLGFKLDEVVQLPKLDDGTHCREAAQLATHRLADVRARPADLQHMEATLSQLLKACRTHRGQVSCPLIAALH